VNLFPFTTPKHSMSFFFRRVVHTNSETWPPLANTWSLMSIFPLLWNRQTIENHLIILVRQSFGSTEPLGTAPIINLQYELLITRIIRSVDTVKQTPLRLTQIQNPELCGENAATSSCSIFMDTLIIGTVLSTMLM
jgi:hypothetical protein